MKNKQSYLAPEAELLEVRFEKRFLTESSENTGETMNYRDMPTGSGFTFDNN